MYTWHTMVEILGDTPHFLYTYCIIVCLGKIPFSKISSYRNQLIDLLKNLFERFLYIAILAFNSLKRVCHYAARINDDHMISVTTVMMTIVIFVWFVRFLYGWFMLLFGVRYECYKRLYQRKWIRMVKLNLDGNFYGKW